MADPAAPSTTTTTTTSGAAGPDSGGTPPSPPLPLADGPSATALPAVPDGVAASSIDGPPVTDAATAAPPPKKKKAKKARADGTVKKRKKSVAEQTLLGIGGGGASTAEHIPLRPVSATPATATDGAAVRINIPTDPIEPSPAAAAAAPAAAAAEPPRYVTTLDNETSKVVAVQPAPFTSQYATEERTVRAPPRTYPF
jgi:hypothetical protein